ncbi:MAG: CDP-diacylglycerol--serine O-phosphatidyltransferase [Xanthobacteraceae bacterium]|nr:CDP-diacylglycerol--serine O-phosphatidyltransferase [Xanthobacteraceae bacterium]QYK45886.1 MAG: CDP-diacylglycerol--serine O-phosphatidyltransferase [Xanthobacteraceae bacterium]
MSLFPPFEPGGEHPRRKFRRIPIRALLPNLVTLLALCLGLTAIRMAIEGRMDLAIAGIVLAAILDGVDGRLARYLQSQSRFGAELDSLADFMNFGCAPALILFFWGLGPLKTLGWIVMLVFALCAALRLARFNVMLDDPNRPAFAGNFFVGIPAPAAAIVVLLPVYLEMLGVPRFSFSPSLYLVYALGIALLMVSTIPTWSGKKLGARVPREYVLPILVLAVLFVATLLSYPWELLTVIVLGYLTTIPLAYFHYKRLEKAHVIGGEAVIAPQEDIENRPDRLN